MILVFIKYTFHTYENNTCEDPVHTITFDTIAGCISMQGNIIMKVMENTILFVL